MSVHFSSDKQTWETPQDFFNNLNRIFNFNLDSCAEHETAKVEKYFTVKDDALTQEWIGSVWCNPPYGREQIKFINKGIEQHKKHNSIIVFLIPARPDTKLWQEVIFKESSQICFVRGRLKFGNSKYNAPFPCALVVLGMEVDLSRFGHCIK